MNDDKLKEILAIAEAMSAPPVTPPADAQTRFEAMLARHAPRILSEREMMIVILKILSPAAADGGEISDAIAALRLRLIDGGDGVIFALLARMEAAGMVTGAFDRAMTRKAYTIHPNGMDLLAREQDLVQGLTPSLSGLWAT